MMNAYNAALVSAEDVKVLVHSYVFIEKALYQYSMVF